MADANANAYKETLHYNSIQSIWNATLTQIQTHKRSPRLSVCNTINCALAYMFMFTFLVSNRLVIVIIFRCTGCNLFSKPNNKTRKCTRWRIGSVFLCIVVWRTLNCTGHRAVTMVSRLLFTNNWGINEAVLHSCGITRAWGWVSTDLRPAKLGHQTTGTMTCYTIQ